MTPEWLVHQDDDCPLVQHRIACDECEYPYSEALFGSVEDYMAAACKQLPLDFDGGK